jgi:hypothetical protein
MPLLTNTYLFPVQIDVDAKQMCHSKLSECRAAPRHVRGLAVCLMLSHMQNGRLYEG